MGHPTVTIFAEVLKNDKWISYDTVVKDYVHLFLYDLLIEYDWLKINPEDAGLTARLEYRSYYFNIGGFAGDYVYCIPLDHIKDIGFQLEDEPNLDPDDCDAYTAKIGGVRYMDLDTEQMPEGIADVRWVFWTEY